MIRLLATAFAVVLLVLIIARRCWFERAVEPRAEELHPASNSPQQASRQLHQREKRVSLLRRTVSFGVTALGIAVVALAVAGLVGGWIPGSVAGESGVVVSAAESQAPPPTPRPITTESIRSIAGDSRAEGFSLPTAASSQLGSSSASIGSNIVLTAILRWSPAEVMLPVAEHQGGAVFRSLAGVTLQERTLTSTDGLTYLPVGTATSIGAYIPWPVPPPVSLTDGASSDQRLAGTLLPLVFELEPLIEAFSSSSTTSEEGARAAIAVMDLQTGERVAVNGDTQFQAASTIKFYVLLSVLRDIELGYYTFADVESAIWGVMVPQSNASARELTLRTGLRTVNQRLDAWGIHNTIITHPSGYTWEPDPLYGHNDNLTTAADAVRGLSLLYNANLAGAKRSRTMLEQFTTLPRHFGIEGAVPDDQGRVFYKVGWLPAEDYSSINDLAIVEFERNGETLACAIAIYTQGAVPQYPAWALVREAASAVWNHFVTVRYPETPMPPPEAAAVTLAVAP